MQNIIRDQKINLKTKMREDATGLLLTRLTGFLNGETHQLTQG